MKTESEPVLTLKINEGKMGKGVGRKVRDYFLNQILLFLILTICSKIIVLGSNFERELSEYFS